MSKTTTAAERAAEKLNKMFLSRMGIKTEPIAAIITKEYEPVLKALTRISNGNDAATMREWANEAIRQWHGW